jgi:taurine dioxygenase
MGTDYRRLSIRRLGVLGAVVEGLDLAQPLDSEAFGELEHALASHEVLFFQGQTLNGDQQLDLARRFGPVSLYPIEKLFGADEPGHQVIVDDADNPPGVDLWHTDVSWLERPPVLAFLTCLEAPEWGGHTMWCSTTAAYDALSPRMKKLLDGLECVHSCHGKFVEIAARKSGVTGLKERIIEAYPPRKHPLVRTHPTTGKRSLYMTDRGVLQRIEGLPEAESEALLTFLAEHVDQPRFQVRWSWSPGELAIWDERTTLHRGVSDHYPQRRVIRRCTVDGEAPFFDPDRRPDLAYQPA